MDVEKLELMNMVTIQNISDSLRVRYYFALASCYFES